MVRGVGGGRTGGERRSRPAPVSQRKGKRSGRRESFSRRVGARAQPGVGWVGPGDSERGTRKSTDFPGQLPQSTRLLSLDWMEGRPDEWLRRHRVSVTQFFEE